MRGLHGSWVAWRTPPAVMAVQASGAGSFRAAGVSPSEDGQGFGISADALCFDHLRGGGKCNAAMATWRRAISMLCWGAVSSGEMPTADDIEGGYTKFEWQFIYFTPRAV